MSRQEDFIEAGIQYRMEHGTPMAIGGGNFAEMAKELNRTKPFEAGCEYGYQYAQQHPAWVSVEEGLPKPKIYKEGKTFPSVLVCLNDGCVDTDAYDTDNKEWCEYDGEVEYWMPLPTPPAEKGGNNEND